MRDLIKAGLFALLLSLQLPAPAAAGPLEDATAAYDRGDFATALRMFRPLADQGNAFAQNKLGDSYLMGLGVRRDFGESANWYRKAAEQGNADAENGLGGMYEHGVGVPQDYTEAARWYRKAADSGKAGGEYNLGVMYATGRGVPRNDAEAARWIHKAADQGGALAQATLGAMYEDGRGVPQDYVQAHKWYDLAATQFPSSERDSQLPVSERNPERELHDVAARDRDRVAARMTPAQIAQAQKLAREWKPQ